MKEEIDKYNFERQTEKVRVKENNENRGRD